LPDLVKLVRIELEPKPKIKNKNKNYIYFILFYFIENFKLKLEGLQRKKKEERTTQH
jgi:hypothetical protein